MVVLHKLRWDHVWRSVSSGPTCSYDPIRAGPDQCHCTALLDVCDGRVIKELINVVAYRGHYLISGDPMGKSSLFFEK